MITLHQFSKILVDFDRPECLRPAHVTESCVQPMESSSTSSHDHLILTRLTILQKSNMAAEECYAACTRINEHAKAAAQDQHVFVRQFHRIVLLMHKIDQFPC